MSKSDVRDALPLTPVTVQILLSLSDGVKHGFGIKHEVEQRTGGAISLGAGTLYGAIQRLLRADMVRQVPPPLSSEGETARWRFYELTPHGRHVLIAEIRRLDADVRTARAKGLATGGAM